MFKKLLKSTAFKVWIGWLVIIFGFLFFIGAMPMDNLFINVVMTIVILVLTASIIMFIRMFIKIIKN